MFNFFLFFSKSGFVCADLTRKTDSVLKIKLGKFFIAGCRVDTKSTPS